jgi:serine/threonine protein kinase
VEDRLVPVLMVERGNDKGMTVKVEPAKTYVVGRNNPQAAVKLNDPMASRAHFQIASVNGGWKVKDMKSRNGTLLNDEKLGPDAEAELKIGDKIQVGETIFSFLSDAKEESAGGGLIGKTIGGYALLERVGRGGMGTVYRAEQISLKREVALKVLSSKLMSDPVFVEKFVAEARAAGGLIHPNIVQVIDVGVDRGVSYFSMEFMNHGSVGDIVAKEGPLPWARALEMMTDAARGLVFAEKKGIIHRDIKPDNLMLTSEGTVKIGDLGLAKKADDATGEGGQIFGTPHFIAPEQAQGKPVDNRADLYALGATFYRVLTGRTPFTGENVKEILLQQIQKEPEPLQKLVPDLPDEMAAVIAKLMKKKPDDRYRSAQGLFDDLESIRVTYHLEAHGQAQSARRSKALAVVLGVAVLAMGGVVFHFVTKEPETKTVTIDNTKKGPENVGPTIDPKEVAERDASNAFSTIVEEGAALLTRAKGPPAETWRKFGNEWRELAGKYEALAKSKPDTAKGRDAAGRAKSIRSDLEKAESAFKARGAEAASELSALNTAADALAAGGKVAEAVAKLQAESRDLLKRSADVLPPDAGKAVAEKIEGLVKGAEDRVAPLLAELADSSGVFPGDRFFAAEDALVPARAGLPAAGAAATKEPALERLRALGKRIDDARKEGAAKAFAAAAAALDADRVAFWKGYLGIRRLAPGDGGPFDETPFFAFQWDAALAKWDALLKEMRTAPFRARVEAKIGHYRRCKRLFETVAGLVKAKRLKDPGFPDAIRRGSAVILDGTALDQVSAAGVPTLRVTGRQKAFVAFKEMTPEEFHRDFLRYPDMVEKKEALPYAPEDLLDLAVFLTEAGLGLDGYMVFATVATGPVSEKLDPAVRKWIQDECTLFTEIHGQGGPVSVFERYRRERGDGARPAELERLRAAIEAQIHDLVLQDRYYTSDFSVLDGSHLGVDGPVPPRLLKPAVEEAVLRSLGTTGGRTIEATEAAPPPPGNGPGNVPPPPPKEGGSAPSPEETSTEKPK